MSSIRQPAVAGLFYPAEPNELSAQVRSFLEQAQSTSITPKALVAPHAGYIYSGPIAGSAYAQLSSRANAVQRVVLLGPTHRMPFRGLAYCGADTFRTPLGDIGVDRQALDQVADLPQVRETDAPFEGEHCLEVQLPFLQGLLTQFKLIPLLVGDASAAEVARVLERFWGGDETLVVISSDLSHYLPYSNAQVIDAETSRAIERLDPEAIADHQACGRIPLKGLLLEARRHGLKADTLDLRNSGDTAGPRNRVVGYGAYVFH